MLEVDAALAIAHAAVHSQGRPDVIVSPVTPPVVTDRSVMVFYNTRAYFEGDAFAGLAGNGPVVVDRRDGTVRWLGTHDDPEVLLAQLESGAAAPEGD